ncbi:phage integrase SAM-like domain-containing protein [Bacteroides reticulotermitis]|uniref:phage integrase SAM-like domain-containing protein n=1 Tax=Bacteroides reticulotermitis TaxID=1133319 RepID=UPI003A8376BA
MATLSLTIRPSRPTTSGKFPIFIRICAKTEKSLIKTDYELDDASQWYNGKVVARSDASMMNKRLLYELKKYKDRLQYLDNHEYYSAKQLKAVLTQRDKAIPDVRTFNDFFRRRIAEMKEEKRDSYAKMMEDTLKVFERAEGDVPMVLMNHITIEHFDRWMKLHGHTDGGRQIRLCHIKARVNEAIKIGLIRCDKHPFAYTAIPTPEPRELDISVNSIRKMINTDVSHSKRLTLAKDMFLLSFYLGGVNFADLIQIDFSSEESISYIRQKSSEHKKKNRRITIRLTPGALAIIAKYKGENGLLEFGYKYSNKNLQCYINMCLKLLSKELNIKESLTFYSARKTFAQFAAEIGIPYPIIEYCLGHSIKTSITINSYVRVKPYQADAAIKRVVEYVNNPEVFRPYIEMRSQMQMMLM